MEKEPAETDKSYAQPTPEEPIKSIEGDGKNDSLEKEQAKPEAEPEKSTVTGEQWRSMMDVVLSIYEYREEE